MVYNQLNLDNYTESTPTSSYHTVSEDILILLICVKGGYFLSEQAVCNKKVQIS